MGDVQFPRCVCKTDFERNGAKMPCCFMRWRRAMLLRTVFVFSDLSEEGLVYSETHILDHCIYVRPNVINGNLGGLASYFDSPTLPSFVCEYDLNYA
jgi:hypothetical protein